MNSQQQSMEMLTVRLILQDYRKYKQDLALAAEEQRIAAASQLQPDGRYAHTDAHDRFVAYNKWRTAEQNANYIRQLALRGLR